MIDDNATDDQIVDRLPTTVDVPITQVHESVRDIGPRGERAVTAVWPDKGVRQLVPPELIQDVKRKERERALYDIETGPLFELGGYAKDAHFVQAIERVEARCRRPPTVYGSWCERYGVNPDRLSSLERATVSLLDLQRQAAIEAEFKTATPVVVEARLRAMMIGDDTDDDTGTFMRWVERRHGAGWAGAPTDNPSALDAILRLQRLIKGMQDARVPDRVHKAKAAIERARTEYQRIKTVHGLSGRRPDPMAA